MKNNKTWIVTEIYYPVLTSTGYIITEIAECLAKKDDNINVICTGSKYNETTNFEFIKNEVKNNVNIYRVNTGNISKDNTTLRIIRLFWSSVILFIKTLKKADKGDTLFVVTNPAFFLILLPIIKKIKGIQYTILVHDVFPENLIAVGKIKKNSILYKIIKSIFDWSYSLSNTCIVIGRDMMKLIQAKTNNKTEIVFISNWSDVTEVFPIDKSNSKMINNLDLADKFVFQFAAGAGAPVGGGQPALVAIVGRSRSGNAALIERLSPELVKLGLRVGTVARRARGLELDRLGDDSWHDGKAGGPASAVALPQRLAFGGGLGDETPLADIVRRSLGDVDLVVAEGFRRTAPHRIELFSRGAGHDEPLCAPREALALVTDAALRPAHRFALDDAAGLARFIAARLDTLRAY